MKKILFVLLFIYGVFNSYLYAQTDILELLTNNSSKEWFYKEIVGDGNIWEEDGINMCMYQTKLVFKNNGLFDKISPCAYPTTIYDNMYSVKNDTLFWNNDTVSIKSISDDTLRLFEKAYIKVDDVIIDTVEWNFTFVSSSNSTGINSILQTNNFEIYPNPCKNQILISGLINHNNIIICNEKGQIIPIQIEQNGSIIQINTSSLERGTYQFIINSNKNRITKSFIKL